MQWNLRCYEEFHAEGAANRKAGRPVLPLHDPDKSSPQEIAENSVGFIDFAVKPVFSEIERFCIAAAQGRDAPGIRPAAVGAILDSLNANRSHHLAAQS